MSPTRTLARVPLPLAAIAGAAALLLGGALALVALPAPAQTVVGTSQQAEVDPPDRVARLGYFDGNVSQLQPGDTDWRTAQLNYPVAAGDRLATQDGGRAELHLGSTALRLAGRTQIEFSTLDDDRAFVTVSEGTLSLRVRQLFPGQHLEVNTGNLAFSINQPGDYRVDVDPASGTTRVTVAAGGGVAYGENGQTQVLGAPQQIRFNGRNLAQSSAQNAAPRDAFDQWAAARDRQEDASVSARYVSREMPGYQALDAYGDWSNDSTLGAVWYPRITVANWAPYRYGHWTWISPWGWTWVDDAPWGFAPSHYGRWTQVGPRWGWVPGPRVPRPVYAPAVVGFVGGNSGGVNWSISVGGGRQPGVGWFPLAPGEAYRPAYRASPTYVTNINRTVVVNRNVTNVYRFQRPEAVTALPADDFRRGRPVRGEFRSVAQADLERARVTDRPDVRPPPRAEAPGRGPDRDRDGRPDRDGDRNARPGGPPPAAQRPDTPRPGPQADGRFDGRPDNRFDNRPSNDRFGQRPGQPQPDLAEQQRQRIERAEERSGGSLTMEQRQQLQQRNDAERRALAEQQQRQLQDGALRQQQEQQQRVQRQQQEQQERVRRQQDEMQDRMRQQQREQQDRQQRSELEQQQRRQQDEQRAGQERAQREQQEQSRRQQAEQQQRQQQMEQQRAAQQAEQQQRAAQQQREAQMAQQREAQMAQQREAQQRQQAEQQQRAQAEQQRAQMEQQRQQQRQQDDAQRAQREAQQREAMRGRQPGGPPKPERPDRRGPDDGRG